MCEKDPEADPERTIRPTKLEVDDSCPRLTPKPKNPHRFRLIYDMKAKPEGILEKDIPENWGATDEIVILAVGKTDETLAVSVGSINGEKPEEPATAEALWAAWMSLTRALSDDPRIGPDRQAVCRSTLRLNELVEMGLAEALAKGLTEILKNGPEDELPKRMAGGKKEVTH